MRYKNPNKRKLRCSKGVTVQPLPLQEGLGEVLLEITILKPSFSKGKVNAYRIKGSVTFNFFFLVSIPEL